LLQGKRKVENSLSKFQMLPSNRNALYKQARSLQVYSLLSFRNSLHQEVIGIYALGRYIEINEVKIVFLRRGRLLLEELYAELEYVMGVSLPKNQFTAAF